MDMNISVPAEFSSKGTSELGLNVLADVKVEVGVVKGLEQQVKPLVNIPETTEEQEMLPPCLKILFSQVDAIEGISCVAYGYYILEMSKSLRRSFVPQADRAI